MKRDLISENDLTREEIQHIFELTDQVKQYRNRLSDHSKGRSVGLVFQKPSNRTRVSFEVAISQLGANCIYLGPKEIDLGIRESATDVAKTLSRYLDAIVARTNTHEDIVELAKNADVPIINGLSDLYHPCQGLTDVYSIREKFPKIKGVNVAYIGDGNNVCHSLMLSCSMVGLNLKVASPKGYEPKDFVVKKASANGKKYGAKLAITNDPKEAVKGADVIYSDVWISMGQEEESQKRIEDFKDYQINGSLAKLAKSNYIFMHCLPAHRGQEVTKEVIDSKHSIIFDQAENRLHVQKAILVFLFDKTYGKK